MFVEYCLLDKKVAVHLSLRSTCNELYSQKWDSNGSILEIRNRNRIWIAYLIERQLNVRKSIICWLSTWVLKSCGGLKFFVKNFLAHNFFLKFFRIFPRPDSDSAGHITPENMFFMLKYENFAPSIFSKGVLLLEQIPKILGAITLRAIFGFEWGLV